MKFLYKYPQAAFPYDDIVRDERPAQPLRAGVRAGRHRRVHSSGYWDVQVEYAKAVAGRHPDPDQRHQPRAERQAKLHLLPTLWFRNTWSWARSDAQAAAPPRRRSASVTASSPPSHPRAGRVAARTATDKPPLLFTENETNTQRCFGTPNASPYVKDGINDYVVHGAQRRGERRAESGRRRRPITSSRWTPARRAVVRLRLAPSAAATKEPFGREFDADAGRAKAEADEFYRSITPPSVAADRANVMRQALARHAVEQAVLLLRHQPVAQATGSRDARSPAAYRRVRATREWVHMVNADVISMPDKWEYPWYAAWDLAFHCLPLAAVDPDFAKQQILLMLKEHYLHPNGQIPAYEWNFGDVNPPVHAWAALYVYHIDKQNRGGTGDVDFLKSAFQKLLLNFTWWVNRKDRTGRNVFEGGFLGLDNIGVFDRSSPLPTGGYLEQADGTAWMAFFSQCMLEIALELAQHDPVYEDLVLKFARALPLRSPSAMDRVGEHDDEMWDEADGFFYDVLRLPDGTATRLKVRSMVGLLSLCATTVITPQSLRAAAAARRARALVPRPQSRPGRQRSPTRASRASAAAGCSRCSTRTSSAAS